MTDLQTLVRTLDETLRIADFDDDSHNGLQVANAGQVTRICCGVDASPDFFQAAHAAGADCCLVHHGISWGPSLARITGTVYETVKFLLDHDMALYAAHLPLDAHPELGNNAGLADALGVVDRRPFGQYHNAAIGVRGRLPEPRAFETLCEQARAATPGGAFHALPFGPPMIRTIGIVSGGAAGEVTQAIDAGLDMYVTGEMNLQAWHAAKTGRINVIAAGHYATERFGVQAVGEWINRTFNIPCTFINFDLPW